MPSTLLQSLKVVIYPELRHFPPWDRERAWNDAREEQFDRLEWVGVLLAVVITVVMTRHADVASGLGERLFMVIANFFIAIPMVGLIAGPLLVFSA